MNPFRACLLALVVLATAFTSVTVSAQANPCDTPKLAGNISAFASTYDFVVCLPKDVTPSKITVTAGTVAKDFVAPTAIGGISLSGEKPYAVSIPLPTTAFSALTVVSNYSFVPSGSSTVAVSSASASFVLVRAVSTNHAQ